MKKNKLLIFGSVLVVALLAAVTVYGAMELGFIGSNKTVCEVLPGSGGAVQAAVVTKDIQEIKSELAPNSYPALAVQKGIPVKWTINADAKNLNSCNNEIIISAYGISKKLEVGENIIEFTPTETGTIRYSCWMNMITSTISIVEDINNFDTVKLSEQINSLPQKTGSCCN